MIHTHIFKYIQLLAFFGSHESVFLIVWFAYCTDVRCVLVGILVCRGAVDMLTLCRCWHACVICLSCKMHPYSLLSIPVTVGLLLLVRNATLMLFVQRAGSR
jgi:hypothetical protein